MKISVLTATYNRGKFLERIYNSLIRNMTSETEDVEVEWLIMDDGSTDNTKEVVEKFVKREKIDVRYFYQENQGKMSAINSLAPNVTGELWIECDSDDYFTDEAFKIIQEAYKEHDNYDEALYAMCFLKYDSKGNNMGNDFKNDMTTMFDLYFKEGETGEKALVFYTEIRKRFMHQLEHGEKFVTEARMYHQMDIGYQMFCVNKPIMICEYQEDVYTRNIMEQYEKYPFGYYNYFKEILDRDMTGVIIRKRLYAIKHFILSAYYMYKKIREEKKKKQ